MRSTHLFTGLAALAALLLAAAAPAHGQAKAMPPQAEMPEFDDRINMSILLRGVEEGACCVGFACVEVDTADDCMTQNGVFLGEGTTCAVGICRDSLGACCIGDSTCTQLSPADCAEQKGEFLGLGMTCEAGTCVAPDAGACCLPDGTCVFVSPGDGPLCVGKGGGTFIPGLRCTEVICQIPCDPGIVWDNGPRDGINAVQSGMMIRNTPDSEAADDAYFPKGFIYRLDEVCGIMVTNDVPSDENPWAMPDAKLLVYQDCDGQPDDSQMPEEYLNPTFEDLGVAPFGGGQWHYVRFCFDLNGRMMDGEGRLWFALVGIGDDDPGVQYYWATCNNGTVQGAVSQVRTGPSSWQPLNATINGPCSDLCLEIRGEKCSCLCDNTPFSADDCGAKIVNLTTYGNRVADNFQVVACKSAELCKVEVWVATNCTPTKTVAEIYGNDCDLPDGDPPIVTLAEPWIFPESETFTSPVTGATLPIWRLCYHVEPGVLLQGARDYWLAVTIQGCSAAGKEGYVLCKDPGIECDIKISQAAYIAPLFNVKDWAPVDEVFGSERDLAFRILARDLQPLPPMPEPVPGQAAGPDGDVNGDGTVDATDVIEVLETLGTD